MTKLKELIASSFSYSGGHFDALNQDSKVLTAISWDMYPSKAFDDLIVRLSKHNLEWAFIVSNHGISYFVIAEGDSFRASGFAVPSGIACDIEEWYEDIPQKRLAFGEDEDDWDQIQELIEQFAEDIVKEVEAYLESNDVYLSDLQDVFAES